MAKFQKPSVEEVRAYCQERRSNIDPEQFWDWYEAKGWLVGKSPMKDWKAAVRTWERNGRQLGGYFNGKQSGNTVRVSGQPGSGEKIDAKAQAQAETRRSETTLPPRQGS